MIEAIKNYDNHTMGKSLIPYIEMKMHHFLDTKEYKIVRIIPKFNRNSVHSSKEKKDKLFNWQRPTAHLNDDILYIECFPGKDYVNHYHSLISTYLHFKNCSHIKVELVEPSNHQINKAILETNILELDYPDTVILGTVEELYSITNSKWIGEGPFKMSKKGNIALVGCEFSFWGDISKYVAKNIIQKGANKILYVGKLGTMNPEIEPNVSLASGNISTIEGNELAWNSFLSFDENEIDNLYIGSHITLASVMQETNSWLIKNKQYDFVDPEIGQMAKGTISAKGSFGYLHIISDNLAKKYDEDLSNERKKEIKEKRTKANAVVIELINGKLKKST